MFRTIGIILLAAGLTALLPPDFLAEQRKHERVRNAIAKKQAVVDQRLQALGIPHGELNLLLVAYKADDVLELYGKRRQDVRYTRIHSYPICARSGSLGPKRRQGDGQVPEGFYHIDRFNPASNFHLSLGLNYPNAADRRKSSHTRLGGDIFIHGACVTIGCLPMTDAAIEEIYLLAIHARNNGQARIPVYIFPFRMNEAAMRTYKNSHRNNPELLSFWENLRTGYALFTREQKELQMSVDVNGNYAFAAQAVP
jgi:murein L,D-transpeptidase YafK